MEKSSLAQCFGDCSFVEAVNVKTIYHFQIHRIPEQCWTAIGGTLLLERGAGNSKHVTRDYSE